MTRSLPQPSKTHNVFIASKPGHPDMHISERIERTIDVMRNLRRDGFTVNVLRAL